MHNSWNCLQVALLCGCCCLIGWCAEAQALQRDEASMSNSIATPGQPLYYLMADAGSTVGPNVELKRTNRSLMKWWEDLFRQNNCCNGNNNNLLYNNNLPPGLPVIPNNNCNGLQLNQLDPFKQMQLFKKLPDLWGNTCAGQCGQCGGQQPLNNYAPAPAPGYGGEGYGPSEPQPQPQPQQPQPAAPVDYNAAPAPPSGGYETPNPSYDGPGDGDAGYVAPAPVPAPPPQAVEYATPEPPAAGYEPPAPQPSYEPESPAPAPAPAPESYSKVEEYAQPAKTYSGAQPPQIVYQPIIYLSTSPAAKDELANQLKQSELNYEKPTEQPPPPPAQQLYEQPAPAPLENPAYAPHPAPPAPCNAPTCAGYMPIWSVPFYSYPTAPAPAPTPAPAPAPAYVAPPAPQPTPPAAAYSSSSCQTPIRLSLIDQPYRVAPELFQEYNYRLALDERNIYSR
ncbi:extensin [Drosophila hydei]|uniref:Extensin n=1 Tax=Drosophila hydei TaxID=7224 RepID=A0A6J1M2C6_DROHY|nr:extensin [Drosophila hydei]